MTPISYMLAGWVLGLVMVCLFYEIRQRVERRWLRSAARKLDDVIRKMEEFNARIGGEVEALDDVNDADPDLARDLRRFH